jgi:hypothetical protein
MRSFDQFEFTHFHSLRVIPIHSWDSSAAGQGFALGGSRPAVGFTGNAFLLRRSTSKMSRSAAGSQLAIGWHRRGEGGRSVNPVA